MGLPWRISLFTLAPIDRQMTDEEIFMHLVSTYLPMSIVESLTDENLPDPTEPENMPSIVTYPTSCLVVRVGGMRHVSSH